VNRSPRLKKKLRLKPNQVPVLVTDPDEVESIKRNGTHDVIGIIAENGKAYAHLPHLERWRERKAAK